MSTFFSGPTPTHLLRLLLLVLMLCSELASAQSNAWIVKRLGLTGSTYMDAQGAGFSESKYLNDMGWAVGHSRLYSGGSSSGQAAWLYNGTDSVRVGLYGSGYSRDDGYQYTEVNALNNQGYSAGVSESYSGSTYTGAAAWINDGVNTTRIGLYGLQFPNSTTRWEKNQIRHLTSQSTVFGRTDSDITTSSYKNYTSWYYDGTTTRAIGLYGGDYIASNGSQRSLTRFTTENGYAAGHSDYNGPSIYVGSPGWEQDAWIFNGTTTVRIGFTNTGTGFRRSEVVGLTNSGQAIGTSRVGGEAVWRTAAWVYDGSSTKRLGLWGGVYTRASDGFERSRAIAINEQGHVVGDSSRYDTGLSTEAWYYNGSTTARIGLFGGRYTDSAGTHSSTPTWISDSGLAFGSSKRYMPNGKDQGQDVWVYNGSTTVRIGLIGPDYISQQGYRSNGFSKLNALDQVAGTTALYKHNGVAVGQVGQAAWFYDGTQTIRLGLTGSEFVRSDGFQRTHVSYLNDLGQLVGHTYREGLPDVFNGPGFPDWDYYGGGPTPGSRLINAADWFYDSESGQIFDLTLSTRSDGYSNSEILYFGDDGTVLGKYSLFDENDNDLGMRFYYFTMDDGLVDLADWLLFSESGLPANEWKNLKDFVQINSQGQLIGTGQYNDGVVSGPSAFLLTPTVAPVPIPMTGCLMASALLGLVGIKRAQRTGSH